ncbi:hypothetical protein IW261DRAFT_1676897 [Armillaria novae-zelandiae]|uniref:Glycoside hydrolase family 76 protein n=1 Tax=Armillaria novae-zelandiae TaxID=153914 RepID=A0AA39NNG1_9AGAR|nr:hypothetical protein IW261DRAFT_1676897 [Armillaria novae-zelandiae]
MPPTLISRVCPPMQSPLIHTDVIIGKRTTAVSNDRRMTSHWVEHDCFETLIAAVFPGSLNPTAEVFAREIQSGTASTEGSCLFFNLMTMMTGILDSLIVNFNHSDISVAELHQRCPIGKLVTWHYLCSQTSSLLQQRASKLRILIKQTNVWKQSDPCTNEKINGIPKILDIFLLWTILQYASPRDASVIDNKKSYNSCGPSNEVAAKVLGLAQSKPVPKVVNLMKMRQSALRCGQTQVMPPFILLWILSVPFIRSCSAQDFTPSILWKNQNPNITLSTDERIAITRAALEKAVSMLQPNGQFNDSAYDTPGRLYGQMAEFDRLTNQTKYKQTLRQCFALAESPNYVLHYGYAAAQAYTAYQDQDFLDLAVTSWATARRYTISDKQAASRTIDVKQFDLSLSCQGVNSDSGRRHSTDPSDTTLDSLASGVSALLAEATSNKTYLDAAIESANFIESHLLNPSNIVLDSISSQSDESIFDPISLQSNESCSVYSTLYSSDGSGIFIEGLVILADITRNTSTETLLHNTVVAVATNTVWQGLDGIIATTTAGGHYIVRALTALYERNISSSDFQQYIKKYIGVQYNAVIEKATSAGSNMYAIPWTGPPRTSFLSYNQTIALTVLLSAVQLVDDQPSVKSSNNPTSSRPPTVTVTTSPSPPKKNVTGAIVGGVMGVLVIFVVTIVRRRRGNHSPPVVDECSPRLHTPFTAVPVPGEVSPENDINQAKNTRYPVDVNRGQSSASPVTVEPDVIRMDVQTGSATPEGATASPLYPSYAERRDAISTEELLRLLHERLQPNRWNDFNGELPPEYQEEQTT